MYNPITATTHVHFVFPQFLQLWSAETGKCYHTYRGHTAEIVSLAPTYERESIILHGSQGFSHSWSQA